MLLTLSSLLPLSSVIVDCGLVVFEHSVSSSLTHPRKPRVSREAYASPGYGRKMQSLNIYLARILRHFPLSLASTPLQ